MPRNLRHKFSSLLALFFKLIIEILISDEIKSALKVIKYNFSSFVDVNRIIFISVI